YKQTPLKHYQALLDPSKPLAAMAKARRDQAWVNICEQIEQAVNIRDKLREILELDTRFSNTLIESIPELQEKARKVFYQRFAWDRDSGEDELLLRKIDNRVFRLVASTHSQGYWSPTIHFRPGRESFLCTELTVSSWGFYSGRSRQPLRPKHRPLVSGHRCKPTAVKFAAQWRKA
ncbi:MAG TPA: hypothetical protein VE860_25355, partial [Chthoniobacterales bacterium]|nr:hypothetical protein [Chthoniobacterales bacterium]